MVSLTKKNKIFLFRFSLLIIIYLKIKMIRNFNPNDYVSRDIQNFAFPLGNKLNNSINSFIKNNSQSNVMIIYGPTQSGKSYLIEHLREELINMSFIPFPINKVCCNNTNFTLPNGSIEVFFDNRTFKYESHNQTLNQQIAELTSAFQECNIPNITQMLANFSLNNKIFVTIHNYGKNRSINSNITQKMTELKNVSFIFETSNYNTLAYNNSNITIINTEPINDSILFLSKDHDYLSSKDAEIVEKSFGGHIGPLSQVVNSVKKGGKIDDIIPSIEKQIYDNLSLIINNFNSTDDTLDICKSSVNLLNVNASHLNLISSLLENGFLYVNDSFVINFANPTVKKFICQKNKTGSKVTENLTIQTSNTTIEINKTGDFLNETSNLINATVKINSTNDLTNETSNVTIEINETVNLANKTSNVTIEINQSIENLNETANATIQINGTEKADNETADSLDAKIKINETESSENGSSNVKIDINETVDLNNESSKGTVKVENNQNNDK